VVGKKASRAINREQQAAAAAARRHGHSLAPEHIGEAGSVAILAIAILGLAVIIAALAMIVAGMTLGGRFGADPPPNANQLGGGQILGGIGLVVLGAALVGSALAVLADIRRSRIVAAAISGIAAILSAAGVIYVTSLPKGGAVLPAALAIATLIFAVAAIILGRPRR
jgi:hypothetical protein